MDLPDSTLAIARPENTVRYERFGFCADVLTFTEASQRRRGRARTSVRTRPDC